MASDLELHKISHDPSAVRAIASAVLGGTDAAHTEWELDFLESMAVRESEEPISYRQCEKLLEIRDDSLRVDAYRGLSVAGLIKNCWMCRFDLDDDGDIDFLDQLKESGATSVKRNTLRRLVGCARRLGLIDGHM